MLWLKRYVHEERIVYPYCKKHESLVTECGRRVVEDSTACYESL